MIKTTEIPKPKSVIRVTPLITAWELNRQLGAGEAVTVVDVRDPAAFHARHIPKSVNAPDSQTTALVKKLQSLPRAVLVCEDGKMSGMVAKTLGFCNINHVAALDGGLGAWARNGGRLAETTRSGFEKLLPAEEESEPVPEKPGLAAQLLAAGSALKGYFFSSTR